MKKIVVSLFSICVFVQVQAGNRDSTLYYTLPDSVKAVQFMATIRVQSVTAKKEAFAGIQTDLVSLRLEWEPSEREIVFQFPEKATVVTTGADIRKDEKGELVFSYNWAPDEAYQLLIATAGDSAGNFSLYTGYAWLPRERKWKMIGTCKIDGRWNSLQQPALSWSSGRKQGIRVTASDVWCQRNTGSWKNLRNETAPVPVIALTGHMDSLWQQQTETAIIEAAIRNGKTDAVKNKEGVYYTILKEGGGRPVFLDDTVQVQYKGYLFSDGSVFDQTRERPASFPLKRLIRGWQIGVPLCKEGGTIKLVIPSGLAYSIRTRSPKIPPNSILVFEITVLKAKPPEEVR